MGEAFRNFTGGMGDILALIHDAFTYDETMKVFTTARAKAKLALDAAEKAKDFMAANPEAGGNLSGSISPTVMQDVTRVYDRINSLYIALGATIERIQKAKDTLKIGGVALNFGTGGAFGKAIGAFTNVTSNAGAAIDSFNDAYDSFASGDYVGGVKNLIHTGGQIMDLVTDSDGYDAALDTHRRQEALEDSYSQRYKDGEIGFFEMLFGFTGATTGNFLGIVDAGTNYASSAFPSNKMLKMLGIDPFDIPDSWVENTSDFLGNAGENLGATLDYGISRVKLTISSWLD